jgi:predicted phosphoribosyltransferase
MYFDRIEAGIILAKELDRYKDVPGVVLAVPRGGVPIAYIVAKELNMPIDLLLTKKIGHPTNSEYAIGAVSLTDRYIVPHENIPDEYIETETENIRKRLQQLYKKFMGNQEPEPITGKTVIIIDDGIATGNTLMSTIGMIKKNHPSRIVVAVPVASTMALEKISAVVDEVVCPLVPPYFYGVGGFYENFEQVSDEEVMDYLEKFRALKKAGQ